MKKLLAGFGLAASVILLIGAAASLPRYVGTFVGNGASVTNANASNLASGTVANARLPALISVDTVIGTTKVSAGEENVVLNENGNISFSGQIFGDGSQLTGIVGGGGGMPGTNTVIAYGSPSRTNSIGIGANGTSITGQVQVAGSIISSLVASNDTVVVFNHDPTISGTVGTNAGNVGGVTFGQIYNSDFFNNGPASGTNYIDDTWSIGMNVGTLAGDLDNTNFARLNLTFESKFYNGSVFGQEFHLQGVNSNGTTFRPLSAFIAHDGSYVSGGFNVDEFILSDKSANVLMQVSDTNNAVALYNGLKLRFGQNNVPAITQINAAGNAYLDLLYLDAGNVANIEAPLYITGPRAGSGGNFFAGYFAAIQPTTANSGDTILILQGPTLTGNQNGLVARTTATGLFQHEFNNQGAGDSQVYIAVEGAGDPNVKFEVNGGGRFTMGIDNSDSDKFKISTGAALGNDDVVTIDSSGNVTAMTNLNVGGNVTITNSLTALGGLVTLKGQTIVSDQAQGFRIGQGNIVAGTYTDLIMLGTGNVLDSQIGSASVQIIGFGNTVTNGSGISILGDNNTVDSSIDQIALGHLNKLTGDVDQRFAIGFFNTISSGYSGAIGDNITNTENYTIDLGPSDPSKTTFGLTNVIFRVPIHGDGSGLTNLPGGSGSGFPLTVDTVLGTNGSNAGGLTRSLSYVTNYDNQGLTAFRWRTEATDAYVYADDDGNIHVNAGGGNFIADQSVAAAGKFYGDGEGITNIQSSALPNPLVLTTVIVGNVNFTGGLKWATNGVADVTLLDLTKTYAHTNHTAAFTISGFTPGSFDTSGTNYQFATRDITNNSVGAKAITYPASWFDLGGKGNPYYNTNVCVLSLWIIPNVRTNVLWAGR